MPSVRLLSTNVFYRIICDHEGLDLNALSNVLTYRIYLILCNNAFYNSPPPLLPVHHPPLPLGSLSFHFLPFLSAPTRNSDHLSHLRSSKEGQNHVCRSLPSEEQGMEGVLGCFHPWRFPTLSDLGLPRLAVHKEMVAGLHLVLAASPSPI